MSSGFANTRSISTRWMRLSSASHSRTCGSAVAITARFWAWFTSTGRILKRSAYALDMMSVTAVKLIFSGSTWKYGIPALPAYHSVSASSVSSLCGGSDERHFWSAITTSGCSEPGRCARRSAASRSASSRGTRPSAIRSLTTSASARRRSSFDTAATGIQRLPGSGSL